MTNHWLSHFCSFFKMSSKLTHSHSQGICACMSDFTDSGRMFEYLSFRHENNLEDKSSVLLEKCFYISNLSFVFLLFLFFFLDPHMLPSLEYKVRKLLAISALHLAFSPLLHTPWVALYESNFILKDLGSLKWTETSSPFHCACSLPEMDVDL